MTWPIAMGLAATALLATVTALAVGRKARKPSKPLDPGDRAIVHTVYALGYDPAKCLIRLEQHPKPGIRLLTRDGRPLRFIRASEIKRKQADPEFRRRFAAARAM